MKVVQFLEPHLGVSVIDLLSVWIRARFHSNDTPSFPFSLVYVKHLVCKSVFVWTVTLHFSLLTLEPFMYCGWTQCLCLIIWGKACRIMEGFSPIGANYFP